MTKGKQLNLFNLSDKELEVLNTLIKEGWYGTFEELIECARGLAI